MRKLPPGAKLIGDSVYAVQYRNAGDGQNYTHDFSNFRDTLMYGMPDGSVFLVSRSGAKLHDTFTVGDDE